MEMPPAAALPLLWDLTPQAVVLALLRMWLPVMGRCHLLWAAAPAAA